MHSYVISFHNHLPLPRNRWCEVAAVRVGKRMIRSAFQSGIDILCLNQWATAPKPFFFYDALACDRISRLYEIEDRCGYMVVWNGERRLLLMKGLEIAVLTNEGALGEVILLGVDSTFPIEVGELPGLTASPRQKRRLWRHVCAYVDAGRAWLSVIPHPCFKDGFGPALTEKLVRSGRLDTFERHNSMLDLLYPSANREALAIERLLSSYSGSHFFGITGNDGIDPQALTTSVTRVVLDTEPAGHESLLDSLADKIRLGDILPQCKRAHLSSATWKLMHSQRKWYHLRKSFLKIRRPRVVPL